MRQALPKASAWGTMGAVPHDSADPSALADLAERSRRIDAAELGRRLRRARALAGMTQAQVARPEVTGAHLSRIEDGQRRPDFELLQAMVGRMGTTLEAVLGESTSDEVLALQVELDHAELSLASGDAATALGSVSSLIERLPKSGPGSELRRSCDQLRAACLEATGDLNGAIIALEDLTAAPTADAAWLRSLISLSRCYGDTGDFGRAIAVGEQAAATIKRLGLEGTTEAIQLSVTVAGAHMLRGDLDEAMRVCRRAIEAADKFDSPPGKASAYWNASLIESRNGSPATALDLARKALAQFEISEDARNHARLRAQIANFQLRQDPPDADGALETLDIAEAALSWSNASTLDKGRTLVTRARAHLLRGEFDEANRCLANSRDITPSDAPGTTASIEALAGQVALASGDPTAAHRHLLSAVAILTSVGADREAAQLWFELGTALAEAGDTEAAMNAFRRAGASTGLAAGTPAQARLMA